MKLTTEITCREEALAAIDILGDNQEKIDARKPLATGQTGRPERPDGPARQAHRAGPTNASGRPDRHFGQARQTNRAGPNQWAGRRVIGR